MSSVILDRDRLSCFYPLA